jgi:hypothetical protein
MLPCADMSRVPPDSPAPNDAFEVLGLRPEYRISAQELRRRWLQMAAKSHPDAAGSLTTGTCVNDAFRVLSDPILRANLLLQRFRAPAGDERAMPQGFLLDMVELRERADELQGDPPRLAELRAEADRRREEAIEGIARTFDGVQSERITTEDAQAVRVLLNVVRAFDRMLEQLDREAGVP